MTAMTDEGRMKPGPKPGTATRHWTRYEIQRLFDLYQLAHMSPDKIAAVMGRAMDVATLGDDEARSVGLSLGPLRAWMFLLAGALTAGAVALCGPIGFVGLIAPHAARLVLGPHHTPLVIGAALAGVILVVGADVARQAIDLGTGRMPIGVFTALIGGPAFIWLLRTGRGQS